MLKHITVNESESTVQRVSFDFNRDVPADFRQEFGLIFSRLLATRPELAIVAAMIDRNFRLTMQMAGPDVAKAFDTLIDQVWFQFDHDRELERRQQAIANEAKQAKIRRMMGE
jgi:MoxR-like ATPase